MGENHCLCDLYLGPPTQMDFMLRSRTRNGCCICLLPSHFDVGMSHKVLCYMKDFYDKLLKTFGCPNFWDRDVYFSISSFQDGRVIFCNINDDNDFLFSL